MRIIVLIVIIAQSVHQTSFKITSTTLEQKERLKILQQKIIDDIYTLRNKELYPADEKDVLEDYEYVDNKKLPITPIIIKSETKSRAALRLPAIKKITTVKFDNTSPAKLRIGNGNTSFSQTRANKRIRKVKRVRVKKPLEIFYRRVYNKDLFSQRIEWVHCMDMVTPLLNGVKVNTSNPKRLSPRDATVKRFIQLLNVNTTMYGQDDIYSILYQISQLHLRLFQWDVGSLNVLLNVIIKEKKHTFANLKHGIKGLFHKWRLDISNTSTLLRQARIFRPPCLQLSSEGSTKSRKITKYPKMISESTPCVDYDDCKY